MQLVMELLIALLKENLQLLGFVQSALLVVFKLVDHAILQSVANQLDRAFALLIEVLEAESRDPFV